MRYLGRCVTTALSDPDRHYGAIDPPPFVPHSFTTDPGGSPVEGQVVVVVDEVVVGGVLAAAPPQPAKNPQSATGRTHRRIPLTGPFCYRLGR